MRSTYRITKAENQCYQEKSCEFLCRVKRQDLFQDRGKLERLWKSEGKATAGKNAIDLDTFPFFFLREQSYFITMTYS